MYAFKDIINVKLKDLDEDLLQSAINTEAMRLSGKCTKNPRPISPKTVSNEWGLITAIINRYHKKLEYEVVLPSKTHKFKELIPAETILQIVKGTDIELAVLLSMWLSFSRSEIRGLTKSKSIDGDYLTIRDLRHVNASVMAMLRIPDKYAQERGGWKTDKVMKDIYTHTFNEERVRVDNIIDAYFEGAMQHEMQHATKKVP